MKKVLIVDDNKDISEMMKMLFLKYNLDARINVTGLNVVEDVIDYQPDLILLDVALPEKLGTQLCKELKQEYNIPIVLVSAFNRDEEAIKECNADGFIQKPFHLVDLLDAAHSHLVPTRVCPDAHLVPSLL